MAVGDKPAPRPVPEAEVNGCVLDPARLGPLKDCMQSCGPDEPRDEWNHSCLHPRTVAYSCGRVVVPGAPNPHDHPEGEQELCRRLAEAAAPLTDGFWALGSESTTPFVPFFLTANSREMAQEAPTAEDIRRLFGGSIYPAAKITLEPLAEEGSWWQFVLDMKAGGPPGSYQPGKDPTVDADIDRWRNMVRWFRSRQEFRGAYYIEIGGYPLDEELNQASLFPCLIVGVTERGSLAGVCSYAVQT